MKILLMWRYYREYLESLYKQHPHLAQLPYRAQMNAILDDYYGYAGSLMRRMAELGHRADMVIVNNQSLQRAWALENGVDLDAAADWRFAIPLEQIRVFAPDVLWIDALFPYYGDFLRQARSHCGAIFAWIACPFPPTLDLSNIDCVLTSSDQFVRQFRQRGKASERVMPAFEPRILERLTETSRICEISFVGTLSNMHSRRIRILRQAASYLPIEIYGMKLAIAWGTLLRKPISAISLVEALALLKRYKGTAWGVQMYQLLHDSYITLNVHIDVADGVSANMRLYEATGCGTLLLTEASPSLREQFAPDIEVVTYQSVSELVQKVNYFRSNRQHRDEIVLAGQEKTLHQHNTLRRSSELLQLFDHYLSH